MRTHASSALRTTISIKTESAAKSKDSASSSTFKKVSVNSATRDTKLSMVSAKRQILMLPATSDVLSGPMVSVPSAPKDGILTLKMYVFQ